MAIRNSAKQRLARLRHDTSAGALPIQVPPKKERSSNEATQIRQRQRYERIPEGNVRRGLRKDEVKD